MQMSLAYFRENENHLSKFLFKFVSNLANCNNPSNSKSYF